MGVFALSADIKLMRMAGAVRGDEGATPEVCRAIALSFQWRRKTHTVSGFWGVSKGAETLLRA